ncbi:hypothetical protein ACFONG_02180 [Uliginosibacterium paludis]|uniref:Uncharacterized protein n=1 Tax=Uliginosibacterium paludis TaxID=1615952 RepID=A0ABV2CSM9_9RHOO
MLNTVSLRSSFFSLALRRTVQLMLLPACLAAAALLAMLGEQFRGFETAPVQAIDASRQVLFLAQADGAVRALHLRHTVGELGMLRAPARREVRDLALDASGRHLWVLGDDATYHYDAWSLKLIERKALSLPGSQRFARVDARDAELAAQPRPLLARRDPE